MVDGVLPLFRRHRAKPLDKPKSNPLFRNEVLSVDFTSPYGQRNNVIGDVSTVDGTPTHTSIGRHGTGAETVAASSEGWSYPFDSKYTLAANEPFTLLLGVTPTATAGDAKPINFRDGSHVLAISTVATTLEWQGQLRVGGATILVNATSAQTVGEFTHVAFKREVDGSLAIWVNGAQENTDVGDASAMTQTANDFTLAHRDTGTPDSFYSGKFNYFRYMKTALPDSYLAQFAQARPAWDLLYTPARRFFPVSHTAAAGDVNSTFRTKGAIEPDGDFTSSNNDMYRWKGAIEPSGVPTVAGGLPPSLTLLGVGV